MARTVRFSQVLWIVTTTWLAACGRIGFGDGRGNSGPPDAAIGSQPPGDGAVGTPDGATSPPPDAPPKGPQAQVQQANAMSAPCGGTPVSSDIVISNTGDRDLLMDSLNAGGQFSILQSLDFPITVAPGENFTLTVVSREAVVGGDVGGDKITGTLTFHTNIASQPNLNIPLSADIVGANLRISSVTPKGITTNDLTFSSVSGECPAAGSIVVQLDHAPSINVSDVDAGASGFVAGGFTSGSIANGAKRTTTISFSSAINCRQSVDVVYSVSSAVVCQLPEVHISFASGSAVCSCGSS